MHCFLTLFIYFFLCFFLLEKWFFLEHHFYIYFCYINAMAKILQKHCWGSRWGTRYKSWLVKSESSSPEACHPLSYLERHRWSCCNWSIYYFWALQVYGWEIQLNVLCTVDEPTCSQIFPTRSSAYETGY